ncbi:PREDICTED: 40S ribosomal protein S11-like [Elephantulus edwardii]|uniref:40S ribosomal protein S11-like n=1 Tax=Elephantulus edwardii TaxID=28737 RepID=UPI0003F06CD0|nr:PREDICTED: 40S ribosomal protein S11-like [Elephantulus edwardii]
MAHIQTERAYQKQPTIFENKKRVAIPIWCGDEDEEASSSAEINATTSASTIASRSITRTCPYTRLPASEMSIQIGSIVTVGECRPLSKTLRFSVLKVTKAMGTKKQFQKF